MPRVPQSMTRLSVGRASTSGRFHRFPCLAKTTPSRKADDYTRCRRDPLCRAAQTRRSFPSMRRGLGARLLWDVPQAPASVIENFQFVRVAVLTTQGWALPRAESSRSLSLRWKKCDEEHGRRIFRHATAVFLSPLFLSCDRLRPPPSHNNHCGPPATTTRRHL